MDRGLPRRRGSSPGPRIAGSRERRYYTACWDGSGTRLAAADVANLDMIGIQIPSSTAAITVANLCVLGITFTK
jgi:hypothetical protein